MDAAVDNGHCAGIAGAAMKTGTVIWQGQAGYASLEEKNSFTTESVGRIASITKPMTAIAVMQLVEQGKLSLDAPVGDYLADFSAGEKKAITVRSVLQHASGLRAYKSRKEQSSFIHYPRLEDALKIFVEDELEFAPGSDFGYTSYGYVVLGLLIETASGIGYEEYLRTHIWEPAGMTETSIEQPNDAHPAKAAMYHQHKPGKVKAIKVTDISDRIPGGGVQSNVVDLLKFGDAVLKGILLKPETLALMVEDSGLKKEGNGYGMGWYLYGTTDQFGTIYGHTGAQLGCSSFIMLLPESGMTAVSLSNTSGAVGDVFQVVNRMMQENVKGEEKR